MRQPNVVNPEGERRGLFMHRSDAIPLVELRSWMAAGTLYVYWIVLNLRFNIVEQYGPLLLTF